MSAGPLGDQPVRDVMREHRWQYPALADKLGVTYMHLYGATRGFTAPSPYLRKHLPEILGTPLEELFTAAALASSYRPYRAAERPWARPLEFSDEAVDAAAAFVEATEVDGNDR